MLFEAARAIENFQALRFRKQQLVFVFTPTVENTSSCDGSANDGLFYFPGNHDKRY